MEVTIDLEHHVRIHEQQPVRPLLKGELHELGTVMTEVDERPALQPPRNSRQGRLDPLTSVIVRARVDDDHDRCGACGAEATIDHRRLVLDDHDETDRRYRDVGHYVTPR